MEREGRRNGRAGASVTIALTNDDKYKLKVFAAITRKSTSEVVQGWIREHCRDIPEIPRAAAAGGEED